MVRCIRILGILQAYVRLIKSMLCLMSEACVPTWCHCRFHLFTCVCHTYMMRHVASGWRFTSKKLSGSSRHPVHSPRVFHFYPGTRVITDVPRFSDHEEDVRRRPSCSFSLHCLLLFYPTVDHDKNKHLFLPYHVAGHNCFCICANRSKKNNHSIGFHEHDGSHCDSRFDSDNKHAPSRNRTMGATPV